MHVNIHKYICVLHLFLKNHLCLLLMVYSLTLLVKWVIPLNACFMAVLQDLFFSEKHLHLKPLTFPISSKNFFTSWNKSFSERGINWHLAICTLPNGQMTSDVEMTSFSQRQSSSAFGLQHGEVCLQTRLQQLGLRSTRETLPVWANSDRVRQKCLLFLTCGLLDKGVLNASINSGKAAFKNTDDKVGLGGHL